MSTEMEMKAKPQQEHALLEKMLGDWTFEAEAIMGEGKDNMKASGSETVRSLGGLWIIGEGEGDMPGGGQMKSVLTLGYDPQRKKYVGTWIGSMMTHMFVYEGTVDASRKILTLECDGPNMTRPGEMAKYQDIHEFVSNDHRILRSQMLGDDGKWIQFMTANYRRRK